MATSAEKKFTILGARGFIGRHLATYLTKCGHAVSAPDALDLISKEQDLGNVIYAIGLTGDFRSRPHETVQSHVCLLSHLLQIANFTSWTYLSSTRIYGLQLSTDSIAEESPIQVRPNLDGLYDLTKLTGEALCLSLDRPEIRIARLSNVYGSGMNPSTFLGSIIQDLRGGQNVEIGEDPKSCKDYISVYDVCEMLEQIALNGKHRIYNLASGAPLTHGAIAVKLNAISGYKVSFRPKAIKRCFPQFDISKLVDEFQFQPRKLVEDLADLLETRNGF